MLRSVYQLQKIDNTVNATDHRRVEYDVTPHDSHTDAPALNLEITKLHACYSL